MWIAHLETEHFSMIAAGHNKPAAAATLWQLWTEHLARGKRENTFANVAALDHYYGIRFYEIEPGQGLIDGERRL